MLQQGLGGSVFYSVCCLVSGQETTYLVSQWRWDTW